MYKPKLSVGDKIRAVGFPMLQKLQDGRIFKVESVYDYLGQPAYKLRRGRMVVYHLAASVDRSIHEDPKGFNNRLEIVK